MGDAKFSTGQVVATPGALKSLEEIGVEPLTLLQRHVSGDWGDVCKDDARANDRALIEGSRIFSAYVFGPVKIWLITEALNDDGEGKRASTCLLLPSEY